MIKEFNIMFETSKLMSNGIKSIVAQVKSIQPQKGALKFQTSTIKIKRNYAPSAKQDFSEINLKCRNRFHNFISNSVNSLSNAIFEKI